jgi:sortase A
MLGRILGIVGKVLVVAGLLILGFVAFQLWGTGIEESRGQEELGEEFAASLPGDPDGEASPVPDSTDPDDLAAELAEVDTATAPAIPPPPEGEPVGIIQIPKIDVSRFVVQGTSRQDLKKGPGRYVGTPLPGQAGNAAIAGHRTTYGAPFNRIDELVPGDTITFSSPQGQFDYEVIAAPGSQTQAWYAVDPSQTQVLNDMGDNRITLTACHPKYSARERIIVHAVLSSGADTAPASPPAADAPSVEEEFDEGLGSAPEELPIAIAWGVAAGVVALAAWWISRKARNGWAAWLVGAPIIAVCIWNAYVHLDRFLPAI